MSLSPWKRTPAVELLTVGRSVALRPAGPRRGPWRPGLEGLEARLVLSVTAQLQDQTLAIAISGGDTAYVDVQNDTIRVADNDQFQNAQAFDATAVTALKATGGNSGEAFVLKSGHLDASLKADDVDAIRFDAGADVKGSLRVNKAAGDLTLDGLRSTHSVIEAFASSGSIAVPGPLTAWEFLKLTASQGTVTIASQGAMRAETGLVDITGGQGIVTAGNVTAGQAINFHNAVTLTDSITVALLDPQPGSLPGNILFTNAIDGPGGLTIRSSTAGTASLAGPVGSQQPLQFLVVTGAQAHVGSVATRGVQTFDSDATTLHGRYQTGGATFVTGGAVTLAGPVEIDTTGPGSGPITFSTTVDGMSGTPSDLTLAAGTEDIYFGGPVGQTVPLGALILTSADSVTATGPMALDGRNASAMTSGLTVGAGVNGVQTLATGSVIQNFAGDGIRVSRGPISGFTVRSNGGWGIVLAGGDSTGSDIHDNTVAENAQGGILVQGANAQVRQNTISRNPVGIALVDASGARVTGNTIVGSTRTGISAVGASRGSVIQGNRIRNVGGVGIALQRAAGLLVGGAAPSAANIIELGAPVPGGPKHLKRVGIQAQGRSPGLVVTGNRISGQHPFALTVNQAPGARFSNNTKLGHGC